MAQVKTIKTNDFEMDVCYFGNGTKNLVILPGISLKPVTANALAIEAGFAIFQEEYTVYLFDQIKHPLEGYTIKDMANDTLKAMQALGIEKASIFGASMGGMMAQLIAIQDPSLVEKLVLASTLSRINPVSKQVISNWKQEAKNHQLDCLNRGFAQKVYCKQTLESFGEAILAGNLDVSDEQMDDFAIRAAAIEQFDCYDDLEKIHCPVLVLGSYDDQVIPIASMKEMVEKLNCEFYFYQEFGHGVYDEASDFRSRMLEFLKK